MSTEIFEVNVLDRIVRKRLCLVNGAIDLIGLSGAEGQWDL